MIHAGNAVRIAKYHVIPGKAAAALDALAGMAEEMKAHEPACLMYSVSADVDNENLICLYEVYEDMDALLAHRETPHFAKYIEGIIVPLLALREGENHRMAIVG